MERMDAVFANHYLAAYDGWRAGAAVSDCWALAFGAAGRTDRTILQHLLLGMNAYINLDLAVAAAETAPGAAIDSLQKDFQAINQILFEQIDNVQDAIASVAPLMWLLDTVGGRSEEKRVEFSLSKARDAAWMQALALAKLDPREETGAISVIDRGIAAIGAAIPDPPGLLVRGALPVIAGFEAQDVARIIDTLQ